MPARRRTGVDQPAPTAARRPRDAAWEELRRLWRMLDPQGRKMVLWFAQEMASQSRSAAGTAAAPGRKRRPGPSGKA